MSNENTARLRRWAESVLAMPAGHHDEDMLAAADHIMATTTPPAMDEVEWDEEKHALTGAVVDVGGGPIEVVMLAGSVDGIDYVTLDGKFGYEPRYYFTPNGKRYELREVGAGESEDDEKPEHPATLTTVEDYENAPRGTIVDLDGTVALRSALGWFYTGNDSAYGAQDMFHLGEGTVLRWGWGE